MKALVTLLPDKYYKKVEEIWNKLKKDFGFERVLVTPYPHFTLSIADEYDDLEENLEYITFHAKPFIVRTDSLGIFSGENPLLFIGISKNPELLEFHSKLWKRMNMTSQGDTKFYAPEYWVPHITLTFASDIKKDNIGKLMEKLAFENFHWEFEVNNISILDGSLETGVHLLRRFDFRS